MIQVIAGKKGSGKTKRIIDMTNQASRESEHDIVFIDDDRRNIREIHRDIRLVDASEHPLINYRELVSFIYGMLSQNSDISEIFIDSLSSILKVLTNDDLVALKNALEKISNDWDVVFYITLNCNPADLPEEMKTIIA